MSQTVIRIAAEQVHAVSLNYRDIAVATSQYHFPVKENAIPCSDAAGVVEVGEGVKGIVKGDYVVGTFDPTNTFGQQEDWLNGQGGPVDGVLREYFTLPGIAVVKLPRDSPLSFSEWSTLVCTGVTAWNALYGNIPLRPGQIVLGQGTGGAAGATTIVTSSSDEKLQSVKAKFGFDYGADYKKHSEWSKEVLRLAGGQGVDYVLENGGSGTISESINAVKMGGNVSMPDVAGLALAKGAVVRGITVGSTLLLQKVVRFVGRKGRSRQAFEYLQSGSHIGKVCIRVAE
ncbi:zinc-dependent alcohol dehydrogenase family protein [Aspergillus foveolatus]|uniref:zinc-dependent alcohol dehydrogenase family protein n=1 Tax=Aspergillus foveolatus TaxID=210207 RepID=UPI003CCCCB43